MQTGLSIYLGWLPITLGAIAVAVTAEASPTPYDRAPMPVADLKQQVAFQPSRPEAKIRDYKVSIPGVLFRGGSIGRRALNEAQLEALCEKGFSNAVYVYNTGEDKNPPAGASCTDRSGHVHFTRYSIKNFLERSGQEDVMAMIRDSIVDPTAGPVFVHCWNGWHASGEIAAMALIQFCGFTGAQASAYWSENIGDPGNLKKYGRVVGRIEAYKPFPALSITAAQKSQVCPVP